jgi:threonine dehydratase
LASGWPAVTTIYEEMAIADVRDAADDSCRTYDATSGADGVVTASAGNMAQGVAYAARLRGVPANIVVPEGAPETKIAAIERFGGRVVALPYDDWWRVLVEGHYDGAAGLFIHPVDDVRVMAGNGTIGLEILEDLPDVDAIVVPYGDGGLIAALATAPSRRRGQRCRCTPSSPRRAPPQPRRSTAGRTRSTTPAPLSTAPGAAR